MARGPQAKKPQRTPAPRNRLVLALVVLLCSALPYLQTVRYGFVWDDRVLIGPQLEVRGVPDLVRLWNTPFDNLLRDSSLSRSYFRPVALYSLAADRALHGDRPAGYHATNVALHALAALLLWLFLVEMSGRQLAATAGAVLFALHPTHPESVAFVSGRTDLIAGVFLFGSLWAAARWGPRSRTPWRKLLPAALLLVPGLFAKEIVLFAAPFPILVLWIADRRSTARTLAAAALPLVAAAAAYYACRIAVLGAAPLPTESPVAGTLPQVYTSLWVLARYVALLVVPLGLSAWHEAPHLARPDAVAVAGLVLLAALPVGLIAALRRRSAWSLPAAVLALTLLPVCWVRILSGSLVAERLLYLPGAAIALAVALLPGPRGAWTVEAGRSHTAEAGRSRPEDAGGAFLAGCGAAAVALLLLLLPRVQVWHDEEALYTSMLRDSPQSPFPHAALAGYYYRAHDLPRAAYHNRRAWELQPDYIVALLNLGAVQDDMGQVDSAFVSIRELLRRRSDYAPGWYALGNLHVHAGAPDSAVAAYETALRFDPHFAQAENNLGVALERSGRPAEALAHYRRAGEILPGYREAQNNRSRLEAELGRKP